MNRHMYHINVVTSYLTIIITVILIILYLDEHDSLAPDVKRWLLNLFLELLDCEQTLFFPKSTETDREFQYNRFVS